MNILKVNQSNINLDNNFDKDDFHATILIRLLDWHIKFKKRKAFKKEWNEELMPVAWDPKR